MSILKATTGSGVSTKVIICDGKYHLADDMPKLNGFMTVVTGNKTYSGDFVNGRFEGKGCLTGNDTTKDGVFKCGEFISGMWTDENTVYKGTFVNGFLTGMGSIFNNDHGTTLEGCFKDDRLSGPGVKTLADGTKQEGYFTSDVLNGPGFQTLPGGPKVAGVFAKGAFTADAKPVKPEPVVDEQDEAKKEMAVLRKRNEDLMKILQMLLEKK